MSNNALEKKQLNLLENQNIKTSSDLRALQTPELVIALCGPIGSPMHEVAESCQELLLREFDYKSCEIIRLSKFIVDHSPQTLEVIPQHGYARINKLITLGNQLRESHGTEILAKLAIKQIAAARQSDESASKVESNSPLTSATKPIRIAHIIDSIKNQNELEILRLVYGDLLYTIGVYSPLPDRVNNLKQQGLTDSEISQLIDRDSGEESENGQSVRQTFPFSDYFLRLENRNSSEVKENAKRFLSLVLGTTNHTPTVDEMAMYAAASAASHSACLSRQVGACVTSYSGEILATGWNDVPKFGGGLYISDESHRNDLRCWNKDGGKCFNDEEKNGLANRVAETLIENELVLKDKREELIKTLREGPGLRDLIEFSRAIHAEMHAILRALQNTGDKVNGGRIYVTTYPCHSCARHIIASGIKEIFFIEPYRKSLAIKLHDDAMTENETDEKKVVLKQYDGVAPRRFISIFKTHSPRKQNDGRMIKRYSDNAMPVVKLTLEAVPRLEAMIVDDLKSLNL